MNEQNSTENPIIDEPHINKFFVWKVAFIAAMGGLLFGYDFMVIGGTTTFYQEFFGLNASKLGLSVGAALVGCIIGAAMSMVLGDKFGRKFLMLFGALGVCVIHSKSPTLKGDLGGCYLSIMSIQSMLSTKII